MTPTVAIAALAIVGASLIFGNVRLERADRPLLADLVLWAAATTLGTAYGIAGFTWTRIVVGLSFGLLGVLVVACLLVILVSTSAPTEEDP